jgi:glucokinase
MAHVALAGDIGGTKTNLALFEVAGPALTPLRETSFPSRAYGSLEAVVAEFLREDHPPIGAAAFGIAGPVVGESVHTTNLPWRVEAEGLRRALSTTRVRLMNDLEATAFGALFLPPEQLETLNAGVPRAGHRGVIAAGTGLGQAFLFWDGTRHVPVATEGGHVDFAPRNATETELLAFLRRDHERVSYERILSGPGLFNIFRFLSEGQARPVDPAVARRLAHEDPGAVVGEAGTTGACPTCAAAVDLFVDLYGAQAGNLALTVMAVGGVYVGGGIVTKMLPKMRSGLFLRSFVAKGRYRGFVSEIPVWIVLEPKTALIGAAEAARALLDA